MSRATPRSPWPICMFAGLALSAGAFAGIADRAGSGIAETADRQATRSGALGTPVSRDTRGNLNPAPADDAALIERLSRPLADIRAEDVNLSMISDVGAAARRVLSAAVVGAENYLGESVDGVEIPYYEDFEEDATLFAWPGITATMVRGMGRMAGPYRTGSQAVNFNIQPGEGYMMKFDLVIWPSAGSSASTDAFSVLVDGQPAYQQAFTELEKLAPSAKRANTTDPIIVPDVQVAFGSQHGVAEVRFTGGSGILPDYAWGIDNVSIEPMKSPMLSEFDGGGGAPGVTGASSAGGDGSKNFPQPRQAGRRDGVRPNQPSRENPEQPPIDPEEVPAPGTVSVLGFGAAMAMRRRRREG